MAEGRHRRERTAVGKMLDWMVLTTGCLMLATALVGTFLTPATADPATANLFFDISQPI